MRVRIILNINCDTQGLEPKRAQCVSFGTREDATFVRSSFSPCRARVAESPSSVRTPPRLTVSPTPAAHLSISEEGTEPQGPAGQVRTL